MFKSVKINYILNLINTGSQVLFPLITFPYASRVMHPEGIGEVNFFSSIIGYISLFTCLGIPMYAVREIARVRDDANKMQKTAIEILLLHLILTLFGYFIVGVLSLTVPQINEDLALFLLLSLNLLLTAIGCEWFYNGIEDFTYITIRGILVKIVAIVFLFLFVHTRADIIYYGIYTVFGALGGNIFNLYRLRKYIKINTFKGELNIFRHLKPALTVFVFSMVTSIYLQLSPVLLGFLKNTQSVGYYTSATKIMQMMMMLSTCLGTAMMPRVSNLIAEGNKSEFKRLAQKAYDFTIATALPLSIGIILTSKYIVDVLCGPSFYDAVLPLQIVASNILIVGISMVLGYQLLYPMGFLKIVIKCSVYGAITNLILNIILIPSYAQNGTAVAYLAAELVTTIVMFYLGKKSLPISYVRSHYLVYIVGSCVMWGVLFLVEQYIHLQSLFMLILMGGVGIIIYLSCLLICKDELITPTVKGIYLKFKR